MALSPAYCIRRKRLGLRFLFAAIVASLVLTFLKQKDVLLGTRREYEASKRTEHEIKQTSEGVGVVVILLHAESSEKLLPTFKQAFRSWRQFLLNSIDLFLVLSAEFPLTVEELSKDLGLYDGFQEGSLHAFQLDHSRVYIKAKERVFTAPVETDVLFHCNGIRRDIGFSRFYVEGNAWYTYQLFLQHSKFLSKYTFFLKIDYDIFFFKPIYPALLNTFSEKEVIFMHGGIVYGENCAKKAREISNDYLRAHNLVSKSKRIRAKNSKGEDFEINIPASCDLYYGNFVGGLVSFFSSNEVLRYAKHMFVHGNYFNFRWTDQVYWHNALGIHVKNFETRVKSLEHLRIPRKSASVPQHGSFVHTKKLEDKLLNAYNERLADA